VDSSLTTLSFAYESAMFLEIGLNGGLGAGVKAIKRLLGERAVNSQHRSGVAGSCIPAHRATTLSKAFYFSLTSTHALIVHCIYCNLAPVLLTFCSSAG
jgi:hypothetical protein